jgi:hypothetical protein
LIKFHLIRLRTIPAAETPAVQTFLRLTFQANSETTTQYFKAQWLAYAPPRSTQESLHFFRAQHLHIPQNLNKKWLFPYTALTAPYNGSSFLCGTK